MLNNKKPKVVLVNCNRCKKEFVKARTVALQSTRHFCSNTCKYIYQRRVGKDEDGRWADTFE